MGEGNKWSYDKKQAKKKKKQMQADWYRQSTEEDYGSQTGKEKFK